MEELRMLLETVGKLPQMALWVAIGFWAYKVVVVGSIYGVIRFVVAKVHSWATTPRHEIVQLRPMLAGICMQGVSADELIEQVKRARRSTGNYMHSSDLQWLRQAIDDRITKDEVAAAAARVPPR